MRTTHYTLTPADIRTHAQSLCHQHIRLKGHGPVCTASMLWTVLFYAASRIISIAAACASLRDAPSSGVTAVPQDKSRGLGRMG